MMKTVTRTAETNTAKAVLPISKQSFSRPSMLAVSHRQVPRNMPPAARPASPHGPNQAAKLLPDINRQHNEEARVSPPPIVNAGEAIAIQRQCSCGAGAVTGGCSDCDDESRSSGTLQHAIQRMADPTAISVDGTELPELSTPSGQGGENVEDPDVALAQIDAGTPSAGASDGATPAPESAGNPPDGSPEEDTSRAVQAASISGGVSGGVVSPNAVLARLGDGQPISFPLRSQMEKVFGHDFARVRLHTDAPANALARSLGAHAFTVGEHIAFGSGRFHPEDSGSGRLVAHELTHVIQQRRGLSGKILHEGVGQPGDSYEQEAEQMANRFTARRTVASPVSTAVAARADGSAVQLFSGSSAATYAKTWALKDNPAYAMSDGSPRFGDDCTNFVSQSMEAGGWTYLWGSGACADRKADSVWWFTRRGCKRPIISDIDASFTWGGADNFKRFVSGSGRGAAAAHVYDLEPGDVLQRDHGDGVMHHSMVVTSKGTDTVGGTLINQIWVSYHTNDTLERNFWGPGGFHATTKSGWNYWAWKIK